MTENEYDYDIYVNDTMFDRNMMIKNINNTIDKF